MRGNDGIQAKVCKPAILILDSRQALWIHLRSFQTENAGWGEFPTGVLFAFLF